MRYNSTPNPFTKYLKERMKKKKKKRAEKEIGPAQLSTPRERERERERSEGQRGESTATELADLTSAREEGNGRLAATDGGWVEKK